MSRSRKKQAVYKDPSNTDGKKFANRKLRRKVKQALQREDEDMPLLDEVMNQYDVCDFKVFGDKYRDEEDYKTKLRK